MDDKKHIDRLFQEKFKDFDAKPNPEVWNRISENLLQKKKKRRVLPIWWQIGGVAASLLLILTLGNTLFNNKTTPIQNNPVVNSDNVPQQQLEHNTENLTNKVIENGNLSEKNSNTVSQEKGTTYANQESETQYHKTTQPQINQKLKTTINYKTSKLKGLFANNANTNLREKQSFQNKEHTSTLNFSKSNPTLIESSNFKTKLENLAENQLGFQESATKKPSTPEASNLQKTPESVLDTQSTIDAAITAQKELKENPEQDEAKPKWSITPNVSPIYFSSLAQGSSLDIQFNENSKSSPITMSYGINGAYKISKKLKVRTGINRLDINQKTSNVIAFIGANATARGSNAVYNNISFNPSASNVSIISLAMLDKNTTPELFNTKLSGDLEQQLGFLEVPLELEYRLVDKKIGLNVIGGFSTLFLNENTIYAAVEGESTLIGEANNINATSFSANFGLGLDYAFSKKWTLNLEPTFKYQLNTFNNTSGNFSPFIIGVYSGLSFKF